jgi:hypothetical protein
MKTLNFIDLEATYTYIQLDVKAAKNIGCRASIAGEE